jgi:hypothetical protein
MLGDRFAGYGGGDDAPAVPGDLEDDEGNRDADRGVCPW